MVVTKMGEMVRVQGIFYKAIVKLMILYGRESWVVMGDMLKLLEWFHHRADIRIVGMPAHHMTIRVWEWPSVADSLDTSGLWPIKDCIQCSQASIAAQAAYRTIYELYTGTDRMTEASRFLRWRDQDVGREVECPRGECIFKINCIGEVHYLSVGMEGIWFIPHGIPTHR